jgi:hypothetical protein
MANFTIGTKVTTAENTISVDVTPAAPLSPGKHHFQLVVVDDAGNESDPSVAEIIIKDSTKPTAVLRIAPTQVEPGVSFNLDGRESSDVPPGKVVQYIWTMVD